MGCTTFRRVVLIAFALVMTSFGALAEKRVALVVGNSAYQNVAKLPNPARDGAAMAELLKSAGFDVVSLSDVGNLDFKRAIRRFEEMARDADMAVVFYAGHGIEIGGTNYLVPIDARLASDLDAPDETITLDRLVESVDSSKKLGLVILDACRDNPFVVSMKRQRQASLRSVSAGLGKVEPAVAGTLIAYAAKAGSTAEDGTSEHSPFTTALLKHLIVPGLDVRLAFGRVRDEVMGITGRLQEPYVYGSLGGATVAVVGVPEAIAQQASGPNDPNADARRDYEHFERVGTWEAWDAFLRLHGTGAFADLARMQRARAFAAAEAKQRSSAQTDSPGQPGTLVAATAPADRATPAMPPAGLSPGDLARSLQTELKRVGCYAGSANGEWNAPSRRALDAFGSNANVKLDNKTASLQALEAVRDKQTRVCPLQCGRGLRVEGEQCVAIVCEPGRAIGESGTCEPVKTRTRSVSPAAEPKAERRTRSNTAAGGRAQSGGGGVACDRFGCKPVPRGCQVRTTVFREETQQTVVCN